MITEADLRAGRVDRDDWPSDDVLAVLGADGHAEHGFCEKCWQVAGWRAVSEPTKAQSTHYLDICREVEAIAAKEATDAE